LKYLLKPLSLGSLMNKGVCPHSNQAATHHHDLAFWPLTPLPQVFHLEPFHLPTLWAFFRRPCDAVSSCNMTNTYAKMKRYIYFDIMLLVLVC
jgi:hypothetical protein